MFKILEIIKDIGKRYEPLASMALTGGIVALIIHGSITINGLHTKLSKHHNTVQTVTKALLHGKKIDISQKEKQKLLKLLNEKPAGSRSGLAKFQKDVELRGELHKTKTGVFRLTPQLVVSFWLTDEVTYKQPKKPIEQALVIIEKTLLDQTELLKGTPYEQLLPVAKDIYRRWEREYVQRYKEIKQKQGGQ